MKSFPTKQRVPDYVRDRFHDNNRSLGSSHHNVRGYSQQPPHNYLLPKKIISKQYFNPPKQHQQQQQRYRYPPSNPSNPNAGLSSSTLSCYVCNKSFPSSQFLYSHMMRLHPDRGMKGVLQPQQAPVSVMPSQPQPSNERAMKGVLQPPQATISPTKSVVSSPSGSSSASEYSSDVTESNSGSAKLLLSSWGKKDRRGRTNNPSSCYYTSNVAIASLPKPMEATTTSSTSIPSTKNTIIANEQNPNKRSCTTGNEIAGLIENKLMKMTKRYECNICHKEFDTGHALGGHKSSSACKTVREPKLLESAVDHHHPPQLAVSTSTTENTTIEGVVVVLTAKKTMYDDIEEGEIVEDGEIIDEEGTTTHQPRSHTVFDFDLNELPPEE